MRRSDLTDLTQKMDSVAPGHQYLHSLPDGKIIRIYHMCEGRIEKSVLRITVWHHEACRVIKKVILRDEFFYPTLTHLMDSFSCSPMLFIYK